jgi:hypothetical protein
MMQNRSIPLSALELAEAIREHRAYDGARLDRVLRVDERHGLAEVQAGTPWPAIAATLRPGDERAAHAPTAPASVGESLAYNAAGPDGRPAVQYVESIAVVAPNGELRRASRSANRELFALIAGGHGLFGALYSVTLDIGALSRAVNEAAKPQVLALDQKPNGRPLRLLVPPEKLEAFLCAARAACGQWRMTLAGIELRHTAPENDSFLCWARRDYAAITLRLAAAPVLGAAVRATQLRRELIETAIKHGGSFAVSCTPEATRAQAEACYPELPKFLAEKRRLDPCERMVNPWYLHYRRLFSGKTCAVRFAN